MWEIAELWSGSAIPLPPPHPAQKNRTARAPSGTRNTGVPAPTEAAAQAVLPQQWVRAGEVPAFPFSWVYAASFAGSVVLSSHTHSLRCGLEEYRQLCWLTLRLLAAFASLENNVSRGLCCTATSAKALV